jgi:flagellar motor protein MotB
MSDEHENHEGGGSHGGGGHGGGHGGGGHEEGHEGAPEWLISFADNVALLMGFFVILLAMNMGPKADPVQGGEKNESDAGPGMTQKQADFILAIREGFNTPIDINSTKASERELVKRLRQKRGDATSEGIKGDHDKQQAPRPSDYDRVTASVAFDDSSAVLGSEGIDTLAQVASMQKDQRWIVEVRGHVSPHERMHNDQRAMRLSYDRALAAALVLVDNGMTWASVRVVACGDSDRIVKRTYDRAEDRINQRVEIVVTDYVVADDPYAGK